VGCTDALEGIWQEDGGGLPRASSSASLSSSFCYPAFCTLLPAFSPLLFMLSLAAVSLAWAEGGGGKQGRVACMAGGSMHGRGGWR